MDQSLKKAGIIIIGNEILKGHVQDTNSTFICKRFHAIGVKVCRIATVPDEVEDIAEEVARFSKKFDIVITTGGIGPTHDDLTYEAVATALGDKIILHSEMVDVIRSYFQGSDDIENNPALKMALIPQSSKLIYVLPKSQKETKDSVRHNGLQREKGETPPKRAFPIVQVKNVYVLPGMMEWLHHAFDHLQKIFENTDVNLYTMVMFIKASEFNILNELNKAVANFQDQVLFGCYPSDSSNKEYGTKITFESCSLDDVTAAYSYLKNLLPKACFIERLHSREADLVYELTNGNKSLSKCVRNSLWVIENAFKKYEQKEIYLSFNGGKDCTVLLHLVWAVKKKLKNDSIINTVYIKSDATYPEVDNFITESINLYKLKIVTVYGAIKEALTVLHQCNPEIKAIFMGTRRTDPHSENLEEFQMCDKDWPPLMRVSPILDWSYKDIWDFLRILDVPYCSLYDKGYTSVGNPKNTLPNPALKVAGSNNNYLPAYKLKNGALERQGRH